ncbi:MAG: tetratricopeptide repeat protein, partial [Bacteroidia bacterium]|nr:tetratricopeptide repeat protein [Bacteroidia bacterium]
SEPLKSKITPESPTETPENTPNYKNLNEGKAMGLYYDGKVKEAIEMYENLMAAYPDKHSYYHDQLITLVGPDYEKYKDTPAETEVSHQPREKEKDSGSRSFFEGIDAYEPEPKPAYPTNNYLPLPTDTPDKNADNDTTASFFDSLEPQEPEEPEEQPDFYPASDEDTLRPNEPTPDYPTYTNPPEEESHYLNESQAILLFNQGKNDEAIAIYENLIARNPEKASYYMSQINVLKDTIADYPDKNSIPGKKGAPAPN